MLAELEPRLSAQTVGKREHMANLIIFCHIPTFLHMEVI